MCLRLAAQLNVQPPMTHLRPVDGITRQERNLHLLPEGRLLVARRVIARGPPHFAFATAGAKNARCWAWGNPRTASKYFKILSD